MSEPPHPVQIAATILSILLLAYTGSYLAGFVHGQTRGQQQRVERLALHLEAATRNSIPPTPTLPARPGLDGDPQ